MSIDYTFASKEDREELQSIFDICFGEHDYGEYYFSNFWRPERTLIHKRDGRIAAMLHMLKTEFSLDGETASASYIYSVATRPEYRGMGIMGELIEEAFVIAKAEGADISVLITKGSLFEYYKRFGYEPVFSLSRILPSEVPPGLMCKVRALDINDVEKMLDVYRFSVTGRVAVKRDAARFAEIAGEYEGHMFGLFDFYGNMLSYCLMDDVDENAAEVMGQGCGYLLYTCCMHPERGYGFGLPMPDDADRILKGSARALTERGEIFLSSGRLPPYLNVLYD